MFFNRDLMLNHDDEKEDSEAAVGETPVQSYLTSPYASNSNNRVRFLSQLLGLQLRPRVEELLHPQLERETPAMEEQSNDEENDGDQYRSFHGAINAYLNKVNSRSR